MNQKGSTIVEASLVFPIIILSIMAMIAILMFLFEEAAAQAELHLVIRTEAGRQTGTFHGSSGSSTVSVGRGFYGIHSVMNGKSSVTFEEIEILPLPVHKSLVAYQHLIDERKYARYIDFFTMKEKKDEDHEDNAIQ